MNQILQDSYLEFHIPGHKRMLVDLSTFAVELNITFTVEEGNAIPDATGLGKSVDWVILFLNQ